MTNIENEKRINTIVVLYINKFPGPIVNIGYSGKPNKKQVQIIEKLTKDIHELVEKANKKIYGK